MMFFRDYCTAALTQFVSTRPYLVKSTHTLIVFKSRHTSECAAFHTSLDATCTMNINLPLVQHCNGVEHQFLLRLTRRASV